MTLARRFHHVGIVVSSIAQVEDLVSLLGLRIGRRQYVPEYEAECVFTTGLDPDASAIEFVVPRGGRLSQFNKGRGGLHHVAVEVEDLDHAQTELEQRQVEPPMMK